MLSITGLLSHSVVLSQGRQSTGSAMNQDRSIKGTWRVRGLRAAFASALCGALVFTIAPAAVAAPVTSLAALPTWATTAWSNTDVRVELTGASDPATTAPVSVFYAIDGGDTRAYEETLTVSTEGIHTISYWAVGADGATEETQTATVSIDLHPPASVSTVTGPYVRRAPLRIYAYDGLSGIARIEWRLDSGPWNLGAAVTTPSLSAAALTFRAVDNAGNVESATTVPITIDATSPVTTACLASRYVGRADIPLTAVDRESGVAEIRWTIDGNTWFAGRTARINKPGTYSLQYRSLDHAGNKESTKTKSVLVRKYAVSVAKSPAGTAYVLYRHDGLASWAFRAVLKRADGVPLTNASLILQKSSDGVTWRTAYRLTTDSSGRASRTLRFTRRGRTYWRWYAPSSSMCESGRSGKVRIDAR